MLLNQRITQICLFIFAFIAIFGGILQMYLGQPETNPRLDNIHRFMAGVYFTTGIISFWTAITIKKQNTLVFLIAIGGFMAATGRIISINTVGLPEPNSLWIGYLLPELIVPLIIILTQLRTNSKITKQ
ncbi:uncharacterized protein METZ01_LOCUS40664 [marine metagenome]|uniref:DUF4345 domain-containing protein n=1 Tax=marine metagenome TaxID=408172 RepID=A0A381R880_9ZZZZ